MVLKGHIGYFWQFSAQQARQLRMRPERAGAALWLWHWEQGQTHPSRAQSLQYLHFL